jgi:hypothetical protein
MISCFFKWLKEIKKDDDYVELIPVVSKAGLNQI